MQDLDHEILIKFLDGECSEEEILEVNKWLKIPENKAEFDLIKKIWDTNAPQLPEPDVEDALNNTWRQIAEKENIRVPRANIYRPDFQESESIFSKLFSRNFILKAAAVLIGFILTIYFVGRNFSSPDMINVVVANSQTKIVTLGDGSKVALDAGSSFSYPEEFTDDTRTVELSGEGYFEVAHDAGKPFIVIANNSQIKVLGTKFNITSWKESGKTTVAVTEGKVSFGLPDAKDDNVLIEKGYVSSMQDGGHPSVPVGADISKFVSWQNKERTFQNAAFREVLFQLERWYNLKFELPDESYANELLTINITPAPVDEILDLVATVMNLNYTYSDGVVKFETK